MALKFYLALKFPGKLKFFGTLPRPSVVQPVSEAKPNRLEQKSFNATAKPPTSSQVAPAVEETTVEAFEFTC